MPWYPVARRQNGAVAFPRSFQEYPDAVLSLTRSGGGDLAPRSPLGRRRALTRQDAVDADALRPRLSRTLTEACAVLHRRFATTDD